MARVTLEAIIDASTRGLEAGVAKSKALLTSLGTAGKPAAGGLLATMTTQALGLTNELLQAGGALALMPGAMSLVGTSVATVKLGFKGVGDAIKSDGKEMGNLTKEAQGFVREVVKIKPEVDNIRKAAQSNMMPGLTVALEKIRPLLPIVATGIGQIAKSIGDVAKEAGKDLSAPIFKKDLANIFQANAISVRNFGMAATELLRPLSSVVTVGAQVISFLSASTFGFTRQIAVFIEAKRQSGELARWMMNGVETIRQLISIVYNLGSTLHSVMSAAGEVTGRNLGTIANWVEKLNYYTRQGTPGYEKMVTFFREVNQVGNGVRDIFIGIAKGAADLIGTLAGGPASFREFSSEFERMGASFRNFMGTNEVRAAIAGFGNEVSRTFGVVVDVVETAASNIHLANNDIVTSFHEIIAIALAVGSPLKMVAAVFVILMTESDNFAGATVRLIGSLAKLATSVLNAVEPLFLMAEALVKIAAVVLAPVILGLSYAVEGLAKSMKVVVPLVVAFGVVWGGLLIEGWIASVGGLTAALAHLAGALGITSVVSAFNATMTAMNAIGTALIPTLTGVRATLLGLAATAGVVGAIALLVSVFMNLAQAGDKAKESVKGFMSHLDVSTTTGVKDAISKVTAEMERMRDVWKDWKPTLNPFSTAREEAKAATEEYKKILAVLDTLQTTMENAGQVAVDSGMSMTEFAKAVGANADAVDGSRASIEKFNEQLLRGTTNLRVIATEFGSTNKEAFALADLFGTSLQANMDEVVKRTQELAPSLSQAREQLGMSSVEVATLASHFIDLTANTSTVAQQIEDISAKLQMASAMSGQSAEAVAGLAKVLGVDLMDGSSTARMALDDIASRLADRVPMASFLTKDALNAVGAAALEAKGDVDLFQLTLDILSNQNNLQTQLATTRERILAVGEGTMLTKDATGQYTLMLDQATSASLKNEIALRGIIDQILRATKTQYDQTAATEGSTAATQVATREFENLTGSLFKAAAAKGVDIGKLKEMFGQLGITIGDDGRGVRGLIFAEKGVLPQVDTQFATPGLDQSIQKVMFLGREVAKIPRHVNVSISSTGTISGGVNAAATPRQLGGPVWRNVPFVVGEAGPELFVPNMDGRILDAATTKSLIQKFSKMTARPFGGNFPLQGAEGREGGGFTVNGPMFSVTVNVHANGNKRVAEEVGEEVEKVLSRLSSKLTSGVRGG